ncbi:hypothetical protein KIW84_055657 [Lathyrus oleraceus]|uniref:Uncharacterized protein n=1 Tax=Pisum sativum TaxID=3888 RepID=A0A9D4X0T3_PEA|nr:hypothetical protein KIW84_055657 [Pisum sativum]
MQSMLKEGHKHLSGLDKAVLKNTDACNQLSTITRTSLGPNGMNEMILVLASKAQQEEIGDGVNLTISFAGEFLHGAEELIRMGLHPRRPQGDSFEPLTVKQRKKHISTPVPHDSYSVLPVSSSGRYLAIVWPDIPYFFIYKVNDWSIVDSGSARLLAWGACCDRFAILESSLPPELGNMSKLSYLQLNDNQLVGEIPNEFGKLEHLFELNLANNRLNGSIPHNISSCTERFRSSSPTVSVFFP